MEATLALDSLAATPRRTVATMIVLVLIFGQAVTVAGTQDAEATLSAGVTAGEKVALDFPPGLTDGANLKEKNL